MSLPGGGVCPRHGVLAKTAMSETIDAIRTVGSLTGGYSSSNNNAPFSTVAPAVTTTFFTVPVL